MKKTKSITIGIPVFNESSNIAKLINDIQSQKLDACNVDKIIVSSDGSTDETVKNLKKIRLNKLIVINNPNRLGIHRGLNQIFKRANSEIVVTLDADIKIKSSKFLEELIKPIIEDRAELTSSRILEFKPKNFFQSIIFTSMRLKENLFRIYKNGQNVYTCHGLARAFKKSLYKKIMFSNSIGNDMYSYLFCLKNGLRYEYSKKAIAYYAIPSNILDHYYQSSRFFNAKKIQLLQTDEVKIPILDYLKAFYKSLGIIIKNPIQSMLYPAIVITIKILSKFSQQQETWKIATSTKKL